MWGLDLMKWPGIGALPQKTDTKLMGRDRSESDIFLLSATCNHFHTNQEHARCNLTVVAQKHGPRPNDSPGSLHPLGVNLKVVS